MDNRLQTVSGAGERDLITIADAIEEHTTRRARRRGRAGSTQAFSTRLCTAGFALLQIYAFVARAVYLVAYSTVYTTEEVDFIT